MRIADTKRRADPFTLPTCTSQILASRSDSSTISREIKGISLKDTPILEWRWKADVLPKNGNSCKKEADDQATSGATAATADAGVLYAYQLASRAAMTLLPSMRL